jgi:anthranilate phosphoribosyltransferase
MAALQQTIQMLVDGAPLPAGSVGSAMREIIAGQANDLEVAAFLTAMRMKRETGAELAEAVRVLQEHMVCVNAAGLNAVDTCGTGGDGQGTFNISTAAALVVAACGVPVVKHGNRGVSSSSGSADVLSFLGVKIDAEVATVERCLKEVGFAFCFAPRFHPAMKHVAAVRQRLRFRTIFNLMGPLANPARAKFQLMGVGRMEFLDILAGCVAELGTANALLVHGHDGLDEVTLGAATAVRHVHDGTIEALEWTPTDFGLPPAASTELRVTKAEQSAGRVRSVLNGESGPARDIVLANAAAALFAARNVASLREGVAKAQLAIDNGDASRVLQNLIRVSSS